MANIEHLDARQKPPGIIKATYKYLQKVPPDVIDNDIKILDFRRLQNDDQQLKK